MLQHHDMMLNGLAEPSQLPALVSPSSVNSPNTPTEPIPATGDIPETGSASSEPAKDPMQDFYQLQQDLLLYSLALMGIIFISVWIFYNLNIALNYLIGACTGVVYLRMLAKNVERLGRENQRLSKTRLVLFMGLIILATQWNQLQILPIFLGFLTYKVAIVFYMLQTVLIPDHK